LHRFLATGPWVPHLRGIDSITQVIRVNGLSKFAEPERPREKSPNEKRIKEEASLKAIEIPGEEKPLGKTTESAAVPKSKVIPARKETKPPSKPESLDWLSVQPPPRRNRNAARIRHLGHFPMHHHRTRQRRLLVLAARAHRPLPVCAVMSKDVTEGVPYRTTHRVA